MGDATWIALLYVIGSVLMIIEVFLPAHGLLGLIGLGVVGFGLYRTFNLSQAAGLACLLALMILLPLGLVLSVKYWHRTPLGRRISPPNRRIGDDARLPVDDYAALVGRKGRSLTVLRPVGTCVFDGRRVECIAEGGMIEANVEVEAVRLLDRSLSVRPAGPEARDTATS